MISLLQANAAMLPLADTSVQCCVTSPPYWGLRKYEGEQEIIWDTDPDCQHKWGARHIIKKRGNNAGWDKSTLTKPSDGSPRACQDSSAFGVALNAGQVCVCGAWRGSLGLEPTPELFVSHLVQVFREVWRVLRDDGTLWLNLGDSYAANRSYQVPDSKHIDVGNNSRSRVPAGLKPKDLVGIPWMVAFALRADGWYLRSDIIWAKPNPMPESVRDRPTKSHEYVFLLSKSERYFWDREAVKEDNVTFHDGNYFGGVNKHEGYETRLASGNQYKRKPGRNLRSVWNIATQPYSGAHFATFPEELARRCILAGSRPGDVVLDPFGGSGTVARVAASLGRRAVHCDLAYADQALRRTAGVQYPLTLNHPDGYYRDMAEADALADAGDAE